MKKNIVVNRKLFAVIICLSSYLPYPLRYPWHSPFVKGCVGGYIESSRHRDEKKYFDEIAKVGFQNRANETREDKGRDYGENVAKLRLHQKFAATYLKLEFVALLHSKKEP